MGYIDRTTLNLLKLENESVYAFASKFMPSLPDNKCREWRIRLRELQSVDTFDSIDDECYNLIDQAKVIKEILKAIKDSPSVEERVQGQAIEKIVVYSRYYGLLTGIEI